MFDRDAFHRRAVQTPSHEGVGAMRELLVATLTDEGYEPVADEGGPVAHATREYVSRTAVRDAAAILQTTVERLC